MWRSQRRRSGDRERPGSMVRAPRQPRQEKVGLCHSLRSASQAQRVSWEPALGRTGKAPPCRGPFGAPRAAPTSHALGSNRSVRTPRGEMRDAAEETVPTGQVLPKGPPELDGTELRPPPVRSSPSGPVIKCPQGSMVRGDHSENRCSQCQLQFEFQFSANFSYLPPPLSPPQFSTILRSWFWFLFFCCVLFTAEETAFERIRNMGKARQELVRTKFELHLDSFHYTFLHFLFQALTGRVRGNSKP